MVIKHISFDHKGGWYHYRVHSLKLMNLCRDNLFSLRLYLEEMFKKCPHEYFDLGPRSSALKFNLDGLDLKELRGHEICKLSSLGLEKNNERYNTGHSKVQVFMLENDDKTIAVEVPLWLKAEEASFYQSLFKTDEPLTGHIDLLRIEDNKVWVWDYKPNAGLEKYAATQVYFYALMLSKRSKIPIEKFRCGYFDERHAYLFKPDECRLPKLRNIMEY